MKNIVKLLLLISILFLIFHTLLLPMLHIGGDWPYLYPEQLKTYTFLPPLWLFNSNFGSPNLALWVDSYLHFVVNLFVITMHIPWELTQLIAFFLLPIIFSSASSLYLYHKLFHKISLLPAIIFSSNTYILMVLGGGQVGVALGYSVVPFVIGLYMSILESTRQDSIRRILSKSILCGFLLGLNLLFDIRIAYITISILILFWIYEFITNESGGKASSLIFGLFIPLAIAVLCNLFWILPLMSFGKSSYDSLAGGTNLSQSLRFFSFATFENAYGMLHPNWPENIFGKVGFMKPEFLIFPLIAYSSLLFIQKADKKPVLFFALLSLGGIFLAKGANDPFGSVYIFLFTHIPGFSFFRDPTKWYTLITLCFSMLIPYSLHAFSDQQSWIKHRKATYSCLALLFLLFFLWTIRQAPLGKLGGTFLEQHVPSEYIMLKNKELDEPSFSRTLWIPDAPSFAYSSSLHPIVSATSFFNIANQSTIIQVFKSSSIQRQISEAGIEYIVVPSGKNTSFFQKNGAYDRQLHDSILQSLNTIPWLTKLSTFSDIQVYKTSSHNDLLWVATQPTKLTWEIKNDNILIQFIPPIKKGLLVFSDAYNPNWKIKIGTKTGESIPYKMRYNSFSLENAKQATLYFAPEEHQDISVIISILSFLLFLFLVVFFTIER